MDWIQFLSKELIIDEDRKFGFNPAAPESLLSTLKEQCGLTALPPELEELYTQTNGVDNFLYIKQLNENIATGTWVWPVKKAIEINGSKNKSAIDKRKYKNFNNLFFFTDTGRANLLGFEIRNGMFEKSDVYYWNHEDDEIEWLAPGLKAFLAGWLTGTILT